MNSAPALNDLLAQYSLSMGTFIFGLVIGLVLFILIMSLISMISGKIVKAPNARFGAAILATISYLILVIVIGLLYRFIPAEIYFSRGFEVFNLVVCFFIYSFLYSSFFRTSFSRGLAITVITIIILLALAFVLSTIVS